MEITYKFKVKTSELESSLVEVEDPRSSDFYIDKEQDWLNFSLEFNQDLDFNLEPNMLHKEVYDNKIEYHLNTLDVLLTDVKIDSKLYYYKIINQSYSSSINLEDLILDTDVNDIVEKDGVYYTNTPFYKYFSEGSFCYTHPILNIEEYKIVYDINHILLTTPPNVSLKFKDSLITPKLINEYTFYLPSFYLQNKRTNKVFAHCIESNKKSFVLETAPKINKYLPYHLKSYYKGLSNLFNISFIKNPPKQLQYQSSSHYFRVYKNTTYYSINSEGDITEGSKDSYIFKIKRDVNLENISILKNTYSLYSEDISKPNSHVISLYERNSKINDYGITYHNVDSGIPKINYVSTEEKRIYSNPCSMIKDPRLLVKSMKEDTKYISKTIDFYEDQIYKEFNNINYYSKERDPYDYD